MEPLPQELTSTSEIKSWRSIVTLIVFVLTNIIVLFPFHVPIFVPRWLSDAFLNIFIALRVIPPTSGRRHQSRRLRDDGGGDGKGPPFVRLSFPMNFVTAPLIADLFLLAILAIGRKEVHDGTLGSDHISPIDVMAFFITLAYIAISIDASGLIRYLAFKVLQLGGRTGHRLFLCLYAFFFVLGSFIGNDPIILSGTAFLAYMTRVSSNIEHPRAWIHSQFAIANIASAILVSSNPTNLVLAGAFQIKFIHYTANLIVPVVITAIALFPFLLYIVFTHPSLIPRSIKMHHLPEEAKARKPVNPNIPFGRGNAEDDNSKLLSLEEIMNPFLDKRGAAFGSLIMAATLITVLALNASGSKAGQHPVFWVTLPAAFVMFCWDVGFGWYRRKETREIARKGRQEAERARTETSILQEAKTAPEFAKLADPTATAALGIAEPIPTAEHPGDVQSQGLGVTKVESDVVRKPVTLVSLAKDSLAWSKETFPTATAVALNLPFALVPFAFCMFVLVQGLVTKGWVTVFAYGWDHWVDKTGTVGAVGGMAFLSVVLCNFAGTNIGTTILLSRVIQSWLTIHHKNGTFISERTFWAAVYSMALGVNYGAFSAALSASLAGLLWRDILRRKHIQVRGLEFARVNFPIISVAMVVGCAVLIGEVYIVRGDGPYVPPGFVKEERVSGRA